MANNELLTSDDITQLVNELVAIEAAAREAADTQEAQNRQYNDDLLNQLIAQEIENRETALGGLQSSVNQSITRIDGNVTQLQTLLNLRLDQTATNISQLNLSFEQKVEMLESLRQIVLDTQASMETVQGDETVIGSVANALFDAKAYTDLKISELINGAPELLNTLKELADAIGGNGDFFSNINEQFDDVRDEIASSKQEVLNLLSHGLIKKQKIILNQQHIDDGYVELPHIGIVPDSFDAFMDRLGIFEDEDFELEEVDGKTRLVFINNFEKDGDEEIEVGAELRVKYWIV